MTIDYNVDLETVFHTRSCRLGHYRMLDSDHCSRRVDKNISGLHIERQFMNAQDETSGQPLVDKLLTIEERWDEACSNMDSPALREWHLAQAQRHARTVGSRSDIPFSREELANHVNDIGT